MVDSKRRLILKLARFARRCDEIHAAWDEAATRDAGFDGGEFSGPACSDAAERECDAAAQRLGFATADLAYRAMPVLGLVWRVGMFDAVRMEHGAGPWEYLLQRNAAGALEVNRG